MYVCIADAVANLSVSSIDHSPLLDVDFSLERVLPFLSSSLTLLNAATICLWLTACNACSRSLAAAYTARAACAAFCTSANFARAAVRCWDLCLGDSSRIRRGLAPSLGQICGGSRTRISRITKFRPVSPAPSSVYSIASSTRSSRSSTPRSAAPQQKKRIRRTGAFRVVESDDCCCCCGGGGCCDGCCCCWR